MLIGHESEHSLRMLSGAARARYTEEAHSVHVEAAIAYELGAAHLIPDIARPIRGPSGAQRHPAVDDIYQRFVNGEAHGHKYEVMA